MSPPGIREYSNQQVHLNSIERSQSYGVSNGAPGRTIRINVFEGRRLPMAGNIDRIDVIGGGIDFGENRSCSDVPNDIDRSDEGE